MEFRAQRRHNLKSAQMAREAAAPKEKDEPEANDASDPIDISIYSVEESVAELRELASSAGAEISGEIIQRRDRPDPATLIGSGKIHEIAGAAAMVHSDVVLFDHDLTPSQQRNIEKVIKARVIDRTQLILDIFARHARTREGQLQVELAQLEYMLPRLGGRGKEMSQLGGGIGTRGPGETQLETDRRRIYRRIRHLKEKIEEVRRIRSQQRQRREEVPVPAVALVGYTNAGKSTLFNVLTQADVYASSRMFATLDPTMRSVDLPSKRKVLLSDTVGFIRNLPHGLVTAFRATLEEVQRAALVLHVADASVPQHVAEEQRAQVLKVLEELDASRKLRLDVLNKADLLSPNQRSALPQSSRTVVVSAATREGLDALKKKIDDLLTQDPVINLRLKIPQSEGKALAAVEAGSQIMKRSFRGEHVYLQVQAPESLSRRWKQFLY
jgi:GTP-binding protein HflX